MSGERELEGGGWVAAGARGADDERSAAFGRLTAARLERAYRLAAILLDDPLEAQDAVHDATVQAWTAFDGLRDPARFDAWFDRILVNRCRDRWRRRRVRPISLPDLPDRAAPDGGLDGAERDAVRSALATLDAEHRLVLVLHYVEGYSGTEIAARTGTRQGTVRSRLHYALRALRAAYEAAERAGGGTP